MSDIIKTHSFIISKADLTAALRSFFVASFPVHSQNILSLEISTISPDITDSTKIKIVFEETTRE